MEKDTELEKLKLLMHAMRSVDSSEPPEWEQELREGAWMILRAYPGMGKEGWIQKLLNQYPMEVVDTFGADPAQACAMMNEWWESETYEEENTGICETYQGWSRIFANEKSVMAFDDLVKLKLKLSRFKALKNNRR
ncbi:MAG: hypothetical protein MSG77_01030 [Prevotella sp.]|nr:hypothetical protein [Prevotella sp.]